MLNYVSDFFWIAAVTVLFSPFLLLAVLGSFLSSPFDILGSHGHYLQTTGDTISALLLVIVIYFSFQKQYLLAVGLFLSGLAIQSLTEYLPVLLNLPRELSIDGMTILFLPLAAMLFIASASFFIGHFLKRGAI
jgi:hypothetical protein